MAGTSDRRKSPQEKKRLSLERDRRNLYGESSKGSRKSIRRFKARSNRTARHAETSLLDSLAVVGVEDERLERTEVRLSEVESNRRGGKRKVPDASLADAIAHKMRWRELRRNRKQDSKRIRDAARRAGATGVMISTMNGKITSYRLLG